MNAYKIEVLVLDFDNLGPTEAAAAIENANYPNDCIAPRVMAIETRDIGEWTDEHPLNKRETHNTTYKELFQCEKNAKP